MDWQAISTIATITGAVAGGISSVACIGIGLYVRSEILRNNDELLRRINGTYVKKEVLVEWRTGLESRLSDGSRRFASMEEAIRELSAER